MQATRFPRVLNLCADDVPRICEMLNECQQVLIPAGGETGWVGSWRRTVFNVSRTDPYITCPPEIARIAGLDVCKVPFAIQNEWYEFLEDGVGLQSPGENCRCAGMLGAFDRGFFPTAYDLTEPMRIRVYRTTAEDDGKFLTFQGALDANGNGIYTVDGLDQVAGFRLALGSPFTDSTYTVSAFSGIIKPETAGDVLIYGVDDNDEEHFLSRLKPWETEPRYRRYYVQGLPVNCCDSAETVQITCLAKMEVRAVRYPTDELIIGSIPALIAQAESIRFSGMDSANALVMAQSKHRDAIKYLNEELTHYLGKSKPAVNVAPFGSARLSRQMIGQLW